MTGQVAANLRQAVEHLNTAQDLLAEQGDMHGWTILGYIRAFLSGEKPFTEVAELVCGAEENKRLVPRA